MGIEAGAVRFEMMINDGVVTRTYVQPNTTSGPLSLAAVSVRNDGADLLILAAGSSLFEWDSAFGIE